MQKTNTWKAMIQEQNCHTPCTGMSTTYMNEQVHKRMKLTNVKNFAIKCMQEKLCCRLKDFHAGLGLQTDTSKSG